MDHELGVVGEEAVVVLRGPPGVGKSELARQYGRTRLPRYGGGAFFLDAGGGSLPLSIIEIGRQQLNVVTPSDDSLEDRVLAVFRAVARRPALLIFDNAPGASAISAWVPATGSSCHLVITSVRDDWPGWKAIDVAPLSTTAALGAATHILGKEDGDRYGPQLVELAQGLPIQLVPNCLGLAKAIRRGRADIVDRALSDEARQSFLGVYGLLEPEARLLLHAAAHLYNARIDPRELFQHLQAALGWDDSACRDAAEACLEMHLLTPGTTLSIHQLLVEFLAGLPETDKPDDLPAVRRAQVKRFIAVAYDVSDNPTSDHATALLTYPWKTGHWHDVWEEFTPSDFCKIGAAFFETGRFSEARSWYEAGIDKGRAQAADGELLGSALYQIGYCVSLMGNPTEARALFEAAFKERQRGNDTGDVDHNGLGSCLHQAGVCFKRENNIQRAQLAFEQAVARKRQGPPDKPQDHQSIGSSLHELGICLGRLKRDKEAASRFEEAAVEKRQGNTRGRLDRRSIGKSLHQRGMCLTRLGRLSEAEECFVMALDEKAGGDVHGRVDHDSIGKTYQRLGISRQSRRDLPGAIKAFEKAAQSRGLGDIYRRIDRNGVGNSLHQLALALVQVGNLAGACAQFTSARQEKEQGDFHRRVDKASYRETLRQGAACFRALGDLETASEWERALTGD